MKSAVWLKRCKRAPEGDNTLILYIVGDNGASPTAGLQGSDLQGDLTNVPTVPERLRHIDELGSELFMNGYATAWAWGTNTPFQWTKYIASHFGGTRDPLIVSWPARIKDRGGLRSQFTHVNDVAATIYEVTGIHFPSVVDGVKQQSLDGTSFAYTFDDASASSRHRTQIFENVGNRAIYQDGWVAAALHWLSWTWPYKAADFDKDRWELYHIDSDFSEAHDLATQYPRKLKELQRIFDREARRNNVYPLGAGAWAKLTDSPPPPPLAGRREFIYYPGLPRTPGGLLPDFSQSHRITADVLIPEAGVQGVIIADGSRYGGFALYVKNDRLVYENHFGDSHDVITSKAPLPHGRVVLAYEFVREVTETKKDAGLGGGPGTGRLYVNGQEIGEAKQGAVASEGPLGIGQAFGSPVSSAFSPPFKFNGTLQQVKVELE